MTMYLMIENVGEADVRAFTKLGLSTSRGESAKIGQFGSGAKHGILTLMREALNPVIYCGTTKVEFFSKPNIMGETQYNDMFVKVGTKAPVELSFCLEFGSIDWTDVNMGLRELVSNALDACDNNFHDITIDVVENMRAKAGRTRVFVPLTSSVQQFVNNLSSWFLHFDGSKVEQTIISRETVGKARIYRKGVFVRQMDSWNGEALYDYNFGSNLTIDECRNSNEWDCKSEIGKAIANDRMVVENMFRRFADEKLQSFEAELSEYHLNGKDWWKEVWKNIVGENGVILSPSSTMAEFVIKKGKTPYHVPSGWYKAMEQAGIETGLACLNGLENKGFDIVEPTYRAIELTNLVWGWIVDLNLTNSKDKPKVKCFSKVCDASEKAILFGYCENGTIFINIDFQENLQTYLEEIAHHITGAKDGSREFQEFAFQIATRMTEIIYI